MNSRVWMLSYWWIIMIQITLFQYSVGFQFLSANIFSASLILPLSNFCICIYMQNRWLGERWWGGECNEWRERRVLGRWVVGERDINRNYMALGLNSNFLSYRSFVFSVRLVSVCVCLYLFCCPWGFAIIFLSVINHELFPKCLPTSLEP